MLSCPSFHICFLPLATSLTVLLWFRSEFWSVQSRSSILKTCLSCVTLVEMLLLTNIYIGLLALKKVKWLKVLNYRSFRSSLDGLRQLFIGHVASASQLGLVPVVTHCILVNYSSFFSTEWIPSRQCLHRGLNPDLLHTWVNTRRNGLRLDHWQL